MQPNNSFQPSPPRYDNGWAVDWVGSGFIGKAVSLFEQAEVLAVTIDASYLS
jgi:hypothetical protein